MNTFKAQEVAIFMMMYRNETWKRQQLAAKVARALPEIRRDLEGTPTLLRFESWLKENGVAIGATAEPSKQETHGTWLEVLRLSWVILSRWLSLAKVDFKGACRVFVWGVFRF